MNDKNDELDLEAKTIRGCKGCKYMYDVWSEDGCEDCKTYEKYEEEGALNEDNNK